ncbi:MAG: hypothetical protein FWE37_07190 [Spirochaetaceae bacterium]|nr:hypothetical protein [Spirochaetaceae bacterium]
MIVHLDMLQTVALACISFLLGTALKKKSRLLQKYFIPSPVIGGLIFSLFFYGLTFQDIRIVPNGTIQDFFMNLFFTATGFFVSLKVLKQGGKVALGLAVALVLMIIIQNFIGIALASLFGLPAILGLAMGSVSLSGGLGSAAAYGPVMESLGAYSATAVGLGMATLGLVLGSLAGGPVAFKLIKRYNLSSSGEDTQAQNQQQILLNNDKIFNAIITIALAGGLGSIISYFVNLIPDFTLPYYISCLFSGALIRNLADGRQKDLGLANIDAVRFISLNIFLALALATLNIGQIINLALPMLVIMLVQVIIMMFFAYLVTFRLCGRNYEAAVIAAGHCGVGIGQTPNAIANMASVIEKKGPAPQAWLVLPVVIAVVIPLFNNLIITLFINHNLISAFFINLFR